MLLNSKSVELNGKLGRFYTLTLNTYKDDTIDYQSNLHFKINITKIDNSEDTLIKNNINNTTLFLYINNTLIEKIPFTFNFTYLSSKTFSISNINVNKSSSLNITLKLVVEDTRMMIEDTELSTLISLHNIFENQNHVNLSASVNNDTVSCKVSISSGFNFIEYKLNDALWTKLNSKTFSLNKLDKTMYIQVRAKFDNEYVYSNVCTI